MSGNSIEDRFNSIIDYENIIKIDNYAKANNLTFTASINEMVNNMTYDKNIIDSIDKNIVQSKKVTYLTFELLKQIYSDMSFPKLSNLNDSCTLNEFLRKNKKIDD